jgi:Methyladenine glycosylase
MYRRGGQVRRKPLGTYMRLSIVKETLTDWIGFHCPVEAIQNAKMFLAVQDEFGTFDKYIWGFVGNEQRPRNRMP